MKKEDGFTIPRYSSLCYSPWIHNLLQRPSWSLHWVPSLVKEPLFSGVLDAWIALVQKNTVCRTNIFVLFNMIMHGVEKPSVLTALLSGPSHRNVHTAFLRDTHPFIALQSTLILRYLRNYSLKYRQGE